MAGRKRSTNLKVGSGSKWEPTEAERRAVEVLTAAGFTGPDIAESLGVGHMTLKMHLKEELAHGHTRANRRVAAKLYDKALAGDNACMIFWLKTRAGWREKSEMEVTGAAGVPLVIEVVFVQQGPGIEHESPKDQGRDS